MHPGEDPPGLSVKEHLRLLFLDPAWYPSHALQLVGMVLIAASLVVLVRGGTLPAALRAQMVGNVAAVAAVLATLGALLQPAGQATPITNVQVVAKTLTVPAFGFQHRSPRRDRRVDPHRR